MTTANQIYLSDYIPKSELIVEEHITETPKFPVIDIHGHYGGVMKADSPDSAIENTVNFMKRYGIKKAGNLDGHNGAIQEQVVKKCKPYEDFFITFASIDVKRVDDEDFDSYVKETLQKSKANGIKGIKCWKSFGLVHKDKNGKYLRPDDPRYNVLWETAAELDLPILIHIADPIAFFKPADRFNERIEELTQYPDWAFTEPDMYKFEELLLMQERIIERNPKTTFIIAHFGSYSENLAYVAESLDRFPNMYVDTAARISELGRQPYTSRKFFLKYQDRILFGTDAGPMWAIYPSYYRFLETWDEYFDYSDAEKPGQGRWKIYGIGLEDDILQKVYYKNAERLFNL
ncbi:MAG: amidohydrolase [Clostridia bacterium]|nr:amidohydrolase [Clostridia bacterium]